MARVVLVLLGVSLTIFALIDCARTDRARIPARIPKYLWLILILILPVIGPLLWILFKNQDLFKTNKPVSAGDFLSNRGFPGKKKTDGPKAPDDDPDFLARLEAQNRRRAYEERKRRAADEADPTKTTEDDAGEPSGDTDDTDGDTPRGLYGF
ncbi:MAG: PLDc N-terminal domain-containing protein [Trueperella sp.]|nr:PLDc N-terminal domain-containing protein [Trueperella sp.]